MAQETSAGPTNEKAQKTYEKALKTLSEHKTALALEDFKRADKQDDGHCRACQEQIIKCAIELREWKTAELAAEEMVAGAQGERETAIAHHQLAVVLVDEGLKSHKDEFFARAHEEIAKALTAHANFPDAIYVDGRALAQLRQDEAAKARFEQFLKMTPVDNPDRPRVLRYISRPELARANLAPAFTVTTIDGKRFSLDDLQGKVVLLDFWAMWCGPCVHALPQIREVAKKFQGQPLVILSVSLDSDEQKWKDFVGKHEMTWPQYRDGDFEGPIARMFNVKAIPNTFTIDVDGVLQEEHIGDDDSSIEGELKKLIAQARELHPAEKAQQ